jgi:hypothetical protein
VPDHRSLRDHVLDQLRHPHAHVTFDQAIEGLPSRWRGTRIAGSDLTVWRLVEHLRITQWDFLEYSRDCLKHVSPEWPKGYWPDGDTPADDAAWKRSVAAFRKDAAGIEDLVEDPATDLLAPLPNGSGHTVLRNVFVLVDHNAYHIGQIVLMRRALGAWSDS